MNGELERIAARMRAEGRRPYVIPGGGSNPTGALGYVNAALELITQANDLGLKIDHVVHATGSAGTQAGLIVGLAGIRSGVPLLGVGREGSAGTPGEKRLRAGLRHRRSVRRGWRIARDDVMANCDYVGPGYGISTPASIEAIETLARLEGILLDPVYSGKAMAGLIDLARRGRFKKGENVVFIHTGGSVGLFGLCPRFRLSGAAARVSRRAVGIIGGMGPEATVELMRRVITRTRAEDDADHVHLLVESNPKIPSRIAHLIEGSGSDPLPEILRVAGNLEGAGAEALAMPCNTAHHYADQIQAAVSIPLLHMVKLSVARIAAAGAAARVGLLASTAVLRVGVYAREFAEQGITGVLPHRQDELMALIRGVKRGDSGARSGATAGRDRRRARRSMRHRIDCLQRAVVDLRAARERGPRSRLARRPGGCRGRVRRRANPLDSADMPTGRSPRRRLERVIADPRQRRRRASVHRPGAGAHGPRTPRDPDHQSLFSRPRSKLRASDSCPWAALRTSRARSPIRICGTRAEVFRVVARRVILPSIETVYRHIEAHADADTVVAASSISFGARIAQERLRLPTASRSSAADRHSQPHRQRDVRRRAHLGGSAAVVQAALFRLIDWAAIDRMLERPLNEFRATLALAPVRRVLARWIHSPECVIGFFPDWFAPPQADWPPHTHLVGFPLWDGGGASAPCRTSVQEFLEAGPPPVVFTPGPRPRSRSVFSPNRSRPCAALGARAMLVTNFPSSCRSICRPECRHSATCRSATSCRTRRRWCITAASAHSRKRSRPAFPTSRCRTLTISSITAGGSSSSASGEVSRSSAIARRAPPRRWRRCSMMRAA